MEGPGAEQICLGEGTSVSAKGRPCGRSISSCTARSTSNGRPKASPRQVRPASPLAPHMHSLRRVATTPDPDRLAPAAVLTLRRIPRACSGRYPARSWGQMDRVDARCCCPLLSARQLPRDAGAGSRRPLQAPVAFRSEPARTAAHHGHHQHLWERQPSCFRDRSGSVRRQRANCRLCHLYKVVILHM